MLWKILKKLRLGSEACFCRDKPALEEANTSTRSGFPWGPAKLTNRNGGVAPISGRCCKDSIKSRHIPTALARPVWLYRCHCANWVIADTVRVCVWDSG